jgi:hypothetical protein
MRQSTNLPLPDSLPSLPAWPSNSVANRAWSVLEKPGISAWVAI